MSTYELFSVILASLAVLLSVYVWNEQRKLQRKQLDLQAFTAALDKKQLARLNQQEIDESRTKLSLRRSSNGERLVLMNVGASDALGIHLHAVDPPLEQSLLIQNEVEETFPIDRLRPNEHVELLATDEDTMPSIHKFHLSWKNSDGSTGSDTVTIAR